MTSTLKHVAAAGLALLLALAAGIGGRAWAVRLERKSLHTVGADLFEAKNQGVALACEAFATEDLLPVYGGSELGKESPHNKASLFFEKEPTGFGIFAVGMEGAMPLNLMHRLGAQGESIRGRKVVALLSPTWFLRSTVHPRFYEGNFSLMQAQAFIFNGRLDWPLRMAAARRMLEYPETLKKRPLLRFGLERLAGGTPLDHVLLAAAQPLAQLENAILRAQDHFEVVRYLLGQGLPPKTVFHPHLTTLDWPALLAAATRNTSTGGDANPRPERALREIEAGGDAAFREVVAGAHEWENLELLLRTLTQLGARPLLLSPPLNGPYMDRLGISAEARALFYKRQRELAQRYGFPLVDFQEFEGEPKFLADRHDHPSAVGWVHYNEALNRFWHE